MLPLIVLHGVEGKTGLWKSRNVPKKYDNCSLGNLPDIEPTQTGAFVKQYIEKFEAMVKL